MILLKLAYKDFQSVSRKPGRRAEPAGKDNLGDRPFQRVQDGDRIVPVKVKGAEL